MIRNRRMTLIFDLDGTLLDTLSDLQSSLNVVLTQHHYPPHTLDAVRQFVGNGLGVLVARAIPDGTANADYPMLLQEMQAHYASHCMKQTKPYAGVCTLLQQLHQQQFALAIVSNKPDSQVRALRDLFFADWVTVAIGESPNVRRKPAPDTVFQALKTLHRSTNDAIYIGDSEVDFATANHAGLPCINVLWGFRSEEELRAVGATQFAKTPDALQKMLETQDWLLNDAQEKL